jgi:hypothetical protein
MITIKQLIQTPVDFGSDAPCLVRGFFYGDVQMKTCPRCNIEKPISEFFRDSTKSSGRSSHCKACKRIYMQRRYRENVESITHKCRARRQMTPVQNSAVCKAGYAIRSGKLKPCPCETCGSTTNIQAHHDDYNKPLDVRWLCHSCHTILHVAKRKHMRKERSK